MALVFFLLFPRSLNGARTESGSCPILSRMSDTSPPRLWSGAPSRSPGGAGRRRGLTAVPPPAARGAGGCTELPGECPSYARVSRTRRAGSWSYGACAVEVSYHMRWVACGCGRPEPAEADAEGRSHSARSRRHGQEAEGQERGQVARGAAVSAVTSPSRGGVRGAEPGAVT